MGWTPDPDSQSNYVFFERFNNTITRLFPIKTNDVIVLLVYDNSLEYCSNRNSFPACTVVSKVSRKTPVFISIFDLGFFK